MTTKSLTHAEIGKRLGISPEVTPYRIFYALDPRRAAILLIGGNESADGRFQNTMIPIADGLNETYLDEICIWMSRWIGNYQDKALADAGR
jgi:hypothetical protein